jgi:sulfatase maturation enzyme AslB (radical SAM superfamily)
MLERTAERFGLKPQHLTADSAYGSAENLAWLVKEKQIAPHIFSRSDFVYDPEQDHYICPGGQRLVQYRRNFTNRRSGVTKDGVRFYRARQSDCQRCDLTSLCCPNTPRHRIPRDLGEEGRDVAHALAGTPAFERSRHHRKKIEMLFAHLKRILRLAMLWQTARRRKRLVDRCPSRKS